ARDVQRAWEVLLSGGCTVTELPESRWASSRFLTPGQLTPGHAITRAAAVLEDPFDFDAGYFGISPREAAQMDPQQRILLEQVAEAFNHAGVDPERLDRNRTGVFVGASAADHSTAGIQDARLVESHYMLGNTLSIIANRISFQWDFHGPSTTFDTACSSSLVALDQARRAIASGELDTA
ncbi:polyketide synthase, partial [Thioclava sp. BHET1]